MQKKVAAELEPDTGLPTSALEGRKQCQYPNNTRQFLVSLFATRFEPLTLEAPGGGGGVAADAAAAAEANLDLTFLNCRSLKGSAGGAASSSRRCF